MIGRILCFAVLLLVLLIGGAIALVAGVFESPEVVSASHEWGEVNEESSTVISYVVVENPNPAGFAVGDASIRVEIRLNGVLVGEGGSDGIELEEGTSENRIVTTFDHDQAPDWWATHLENGERTEWTFEVSLTTSVFGRSVSVPVSEESDEFSTHIIEQINSYDPDPVTLASYSVDVTNIDCRWADVTEDSSNLEGTVSIENRTPVTVEVASASFTLFMNDVEVARGQSELNVQIESDEVTDVQLSFMVEHEGLSEWWPTHVRNSERSQVELEVVLTVAGDLPDPVGRLQVELPAITVTEQLETDLLGEAEVE